MPSVLHGQAEVGGYRRTRRAFQQEVPESGGQEIGPGAAKALIETNGQRCTAFREGGTHFYGGQAVIDGVMMRGRTAWSVAVRRKDGLIASRTFPLSDPSLRYPWLKWPLIRGIVTLWDSLSLGIRALNVSANLSLEGLAGEEEAPPQLGTREMVFTVGLALLLGVGLFVIIPLVVARGFGELLANPFAFNVVEGLVRILVFLAYLAGMSAIPELRKVFEYHGAEHKTINAYEAQMPLEPSAVKPFSAVHPRCGTSFLLVVMVVAIIIFSLVGKPPLVWLVVSRILGIPIVAGLAYEIIRYGGRHKDSMLARVLLGPGLALQRLTTREPDDAQIEVAAAALTAVLQAEGPSVGGDQEEHPVAGVGGEAI